MPQYQPSFEEMIDANMRKLQNNDMMAQQQNKSDQFSKEQMMNYAEQFKNKLRQREQLKANVENYTKECKKKIEEFMQWNRE